MTDAPERIWIMPEFAKGLADKPRYISVGEYIRADLHAAEVAALTAERNAALSWAVKVKPLEWTTIGDGKGRDIYSTVYFAWSPYGNYYIGLQPRGENPFSWSGPNNGEGRDFPIPEAAKSAAQADYERRILSALTPAPITAQDAAKPSKKCRDKAKAARKQNRRRQK